MCTHVCCVWICAHGGGGVGMLRKPEEGVGSLELESQEVVKHMARGMEIERHSSARAPSAPNPCAISPALRLLSTSSEQLFKSAQTWVTLLGAWHTLHYCMWRAALKSTGSPLASPRVPTCAGKLWSLSYSFHCLSIVFKNNIQLVLHWANRMLSVAEMIKVYKCRGTLLYTAVGV